VELLKDQIEYASTTPVEDRLSVDLLDYVDVGSKLSAGLRKEIKASCEVLATYNAITAVRKSYLQQGSPVHLSSCD
jgi:hypothetical protein